MNLVLNVSPFGLRSFVRGEEQEKPNSVILYVVVLDEDIFQEVRFKRIKIRLIYTKSLLDILILIAPVSIMLLTERAMSQRK